MAGSRRPHLPSGARPAGVRRFVLLDNDEELTSSAATTSRTWRWRERAVPASCSSPTWRANPIWADRVGVSLEKLDEAQPQGDRADGGAPRRGRDRRRAGGHQRLHWAAGRRLQPGQTMSADAARDYSTQIGTFADTAADMVTASMTYPDEAIGVARAAQDAGLPSAISFTLETDDGCQRPGAGRRDQGGRRCNRARPPTTRPNCARRRISRRPRDRRGVAGADPWPAGERVHDESRGAGRGRA